MKKQITSISIHQTSKIIAFIHFVFAAIFYIPVGIYTAFMIGAGESLPLFLAPFIFLLIVYVTIAIFGFVYNLIASSFGGIEFTISEMHGKGGSLE